MSATNTDYGISVFFPAYNDQDSIQPLVEVALEILPTLTSDYEVIVVNDGSTDGTAAVLEKLSRENSRVRIIEHERNMGYGAALRTGFEQARKDLVFYTDGDGQYDVHELPKLRRLLTDRVDVVNGYKAKRADSMGRRVVGAIYNQIARLLFRLPIRDVDCDFRLLRRKCVENLQITSSSGAVCVEMISKLYRAGFVFAETPVNHYPRIHGNSQFFTPGRLWSTAVDFCLLWCRTIGLAQRNSQTTSILTS